MPPAVLPEMLAPPESCTLPAAYTPPPSPEAVFSAILPPVIEKEASPERYTPPPLPLAVFPVTVPPVIVKEAPSAT